MENEQSELGILLVDDEAQTLKYFRRAFEKEFRIFTATSADEGIDILKKNSDGIAILITDQRMPGKRGVELLKFARIEYSDIVRILTTGYTDLDEAIEAVNSGEIHRYITKPWDLNALQLELRQSMRFFQIRHERDELLREKLSTLQRMEGVNRVRELVAMASGFTATRNPLLAIQSFLEQIPVTTANGVRRNEGGWSQTLEDIEKISTICSQVADQLEGKGAEPFSPVSLDGLLENVVPAESEDELIVDAGELGTATVEINQESLVWALRSVVFWITTSSEGCKITARGSDRNDRIAVELVVDGGSWGETSILDFPWALLGAYLVISHHFGKLVIEEKKEGAFTVLVELPKRQGERDGLSTDLSWLERVLSRFENW